MTSKWGKILLNKCSWNNWLLFLKSRSLLDTIHKIHSRWIKYLSVKNKTLNILENTVGEYDIEILWGYFSKSKVKENIG